MKRFILILIALMGCFFLSSSSLRNDCEHHSHGGICPTCGGEKVVQTPCNACGGRGGNERYSYRDCRACKGTGSIKELVGYQDGQAVYRYRTCSFCNQTGREKAGMEWIRCSSCGGSGGQIKACPRCHGKGWID